MELVLPMYNAHPYFSLKSLGKKCPYTQQYMVQGGEEGKVQDN